MNILNPTGGTIRNDAGGYGFWQAPRGTHLHEGIDYTLPQGPGQLVISPIGGIFERIAYPYSDTQKYTGVEIRGTDIWIKMFYLEPYKAKIGQRLSMGEPVGIAQDISKRYTNVTPHIHLEVVKINPGVLI